MTTDPTETERLHALVADFVHAPDFVRATFGGPVRADKSTPWSRVVVRPLALRGTPHLQFTLYEAKKCTARNVPLDAASTLLGEVLAVGFAAIHLGRAAESVDVRLTRKGKLLFGR